MSLKLNRSAAISPHTIAVGSDTSDVIVTDGYAMGMDHLPAEFEGV